ncbi:MAG: DUF4965 domain-containing protein [Sphingobacteriaceae bacterium]|nr:MAG: DUF4965 domain-containing protein [Sphingobacteriaceae bacterium]
MPFSRKTHYNFTCGAVNLDVNFVSPLFLDDLKMVGRPVSYIQYKANATDNKTHNVKVYFGVSGELAKNQEEEVLSCSKFTHKDIDVLKAGTVNQPVLQTSPETINWGYLYVAVPKKFGAMQLTTGTLQINPFAVTNNALEVQQAARVWLNTIIPFGTVGQQPVERYVEVGYDNPAPIQYFSQNLRPWWNTDGTKLFQDELLQASIDYTEILKKADAFDKSLYADAVKAGGENYAKLCALAYRQSIAAHELVKGPAGELLFLSKENSSGGFINTVDVSYPAFPMYLIYNPQLVEGMLNGIFYYCESNKFKDKFAPHDIGSYPKANGQTYFLPMPIEETGNMILMVAAMEKSLGNVDYAKKHWPMLTKWVDYLVSMGYDPPSQLTSDDFAGIIAHSSNLSAKSINAIAAYAGMARAIGDNAAFQKYYTIAKQMAPKWMAAGDAGDHYKLAFDQPNTWSQKYNIIWDKLLGLNLFPKSVYEKEVKYYLTKQNAFGLPLDNRQTYTKSDWLIWTAIMADSQANFKALTDPVYKFSFQSDSNLPVSDMYQTTTGKRYQFHARSVVGGFFIKMLEQNWLQSDCGVPVSLSADNITANQATVHWMAGNKALGVKIQGKAAGSTNWVTFETAPSSAGHIITGLAPGTKYQWKIASICQNEPLILSDYSAVQEFTTLSKPAVTNGFNISLSPNPVQSTAKLAISNAKGDVTVQLLSLWGKLLWKNNIGKINTLDIPVSNLTQGTYIVTVTDGIEVKTTKLLKVN